MEATVGLVESAFAHCCQRHGAQEEEDDDEEEEEEEEADLRQLCEELKETLVASIRVG